LALECSAAARQNRRSKSEIIHRGSLAATMLKRTARRRSFETMKIVPLGENIVVQRVSAEEKTAGGIVLPDAAREKPTQGRVLSVGDGRLLANGDRAAPQVSEGDRVLFSSYAGSEVVVDGEELLIMSEDEILAVLH
jgi:chaperonin GroES